MTPPADTAQMSLFAYSARRAFARYRTAPPGTKLKRRREWELAVARAL